MGTLDEDIRLIKAVQEFGAKNWENVASRLPGRSKYHCNARYTKKVSENEEGIWDEDDERKLFMSIITHIKDSRDTRRRFVPPESRPKYPKLAYCKEAMLNCLDCGESDEQREDGREESFTGVSIGNIGGDDSRHGEKARKV